ncbi:NADH:flavin oxidoreductase/NADH oxidase [Elioraea sp.]|uniref:NADH:flavin oxidoreductase/NADH oxidase n=1 Tax=Elioraea sp. TaxID=2185103 RepID=UPI00307F030A
MTDLFSPLTLRGVSFRNRIGVSPMCQYCCAEDGQPTDWHLAHLVSRAVSGAALVMAEASAVTPQGRITPRDLGIWGDQHIRPHARLAAAIAAVGAVPAIQLAHAGRKASRRPPWEVGPAEPGWQTVAPSAIPFDGFATPRAMDEGEIEGTIAAFAAAARRAAQAGYRLIELHAAHGYLIHSFLSPLSNRRNDRWGGDLEGRTRFACEVAREVRAAIPEDMPLVVRISHTDWVDGGWTTEESIELARRLKGLGVDAIDVSSGGIDPAQKVPVGPGYQVPGAEAVRRGAGLPVLAVGMITEPDQAQAIIREGKADMVLLARGFLREPYWAMKAAVSLGRTDALAIPPQYERGWSSLGAMAMDRAIGRPMPALA